MDARRRLFQTLRPPCVQLSETAVNVSTGRSPAIELIPELEALRSTLEQLARTNARDFDLKISDYIFYPLSQIFREREKVPFRVLELNLECLKLLLQTGWQTINTPQLAVQLLILLTFLAGPQPLGKRKDVAPEEMLACALACISELFFAVRDSSDVHEALLQTQHIPALGHTITVIIENCKDGSSSSKTQLTALHALASLIQAVSDRDVLQSFFPGIVSALSELLTPSTKVRRVYKVYVKALNVLFSIIKLVLSDTCFGIPRPDQDITTTVDLASTKASSWLETTEAQLKVALSNVIRLRSHDRAEVRAALKELCWLVLVDCEKNLSNCGQMMLETFIALSSADNAETSITRSMDALMLLRPGISDRLRSSLYDWLLGLPRLVQSNDDNARQRLIDQIKTTYSILMNVDLDMSIINNMLLSTMSDSLYNVIEASDSSIDTTLLGMEASDVSLMTLGSSENHLSSKSFNQVLVRQKKSKDTMADLKSLMATLSLSTSSLSIARDALDNARIAQDSSRLSNFYLALTIVRNRAIEDADFNDLINTTETSAGYDSIYDELYTYSRDILTESEDSPQDWRLQALALEAVAVEAQRQKSSFRGELVDALYPIVHLLGSPNEALHEHAIICLNLVARACDYQSAQDLVVSNVDYLVNAIGAKLNAFDISPQAPQVLLMMVQLCGAKLLPYLDDLVDNIFEALECFHGYQPLVELLFSALKVIVEEGAKAPQYAITAGKTISHRKKIAGPTTISAVAEAISKRRAKATQTLETELENLQNTLPEKTPQQPWAELRNASSQSGNSTAHEEDNDDLEPDHSPASTKEETPPLTQQYKLLTRITTLTQHYLPNSSPALRNDLLSLLHTSMPFLSAHEDTFLPLVHTLWPVLIPRLEDKEAFVVVGVLDVLGVIAEGAGDFVAARVEGLWGKIKVLWKRLDREQGGKKEESRVIRKTSVVPQAAGSNIAPLSTMSQNDMLLASSSSSKSAIRPVPATVVLNEPSNALTVSLTRSLTPAPATSPPTTNNTISNYTSTTTTALSNALTRFLIKLITHVRITQTMFEDALYSMLWRDLLRKVEAEHVADVKVATEKPDKGGGVMEALEGVNADAVWLALFRAGVGDEREREMKMPKSVEGGVPWVVVG